MSDTHLLAERALELGGQADGYVVIAEETASAQLRWAGNAMTTGGSTSDRRLIVIATVAGAAGVVSGSGAFDDDAIRRLIGAADRAARQAGPAADAAPLLNGDTGGHAWSEPGATTSIEDLTGFVAGLAGAFDRARQRRRLLFGYAEQQARTTWLASSTGLCRRHVQPAGVLDLTVKTAGHEDSAWGGTGAGGLAAIDPGALYDEVGDRLNWSGRRVELPPGRYEVLLTPSCVADLMLHLYRSAGAKDALDGRTAFGGDGGTRIGERLTRAPLDLWSDPAAAGLDCAPFAIARAGADTFTRFSAGTESVFDNGLALSPTRWISDGVLTALVQTRHSAGLTGLPLTPKIDNLVLAGPPGARSLAELIAGTRRALLLTSLWYLREVDPLTMLLTGTTRDGVHLVENGEVVGAVNNFRFSESPLNVLARVAEVGRTERTLPREWGDHFTRLAMPALRVEDFTMSAVSRAT